MRKRYRSHGGAVGIRDDDPPRDDGGRPSRRKMGAMPDRHGFSEAELKLGGLVRLAYVHLRSAVESNRRATKFTYTPPKRYDLGSADNERKAELPVWPKLARWCAENDIDPVAYVVFAFSWPGLRGLPEPPALMSADLLSSFRDYLAVAQEEVRLSLLKEQDAFESQVTYEMEVAEANKFNAWLSTLTDDRVRLSPLFRYCVAKSVSGLSFELAARYYFDKAVMQFFRHPTAYATYWQQLLPRDFVRQARKSYAEVASRGK